MAGEIRRNQFVDNEVKDLVKKDIPNIIARLESLEKSVKEMYRWRSDHLKKKAISAQKKLDNKAVKTS